MFRIIAIVLLHILADFFLQGTKLSKRKRFKLPALFEHTGIYTLTFLILSPFLLSLTFVQAVVLSLLNGVLHFGVDFVTGRLKKKYWQVDEDKYFTVSGLDQILHVVILVVTYLTLFPGILSHPTIFGQFDKLMIQ